MALLNCAGHYLMKLLSCAGATVVVLVGRKTLRYWNSLSLGLPNVPEIEGTEFQEIAGHKRLFIFLPHPASFDLQKSERSVNLILDCGVLCRIFV